MVHDHEKSSWTTKLSCGVYPEHEGDGEEGEDDEADRPDEDARHDARHHAVRRVDLGTYQCIRWKRPFKMR